MDRHRVHRFDVVHAFQPSILQCDVPERGVSLGWNPLRCVHGLRLLHTRCVHRRQHQQLLRLERRDVRCGKRLLCVSGKSLWACIHQRRLQVERRSLHRSVGLRVVSTNIVHNLLHGRQLRVERHCVHGLQRMWDIRGVGVRGAHWVQMGRHGVCGSDRLRILHASALHCELHQQQLRLVRRGV